MYQQSSIQVSPEERDRRQRMYIFEAELRKAGYKAIAGVDEAGRGPLAGPVVAAAVILPPDVAIEGIDDSKKLSPARREQVYARLRRAGIPFAVGAATVEEIDRLNILVASRMAMMRAVAKLPVRPDFLLIDGYDWPGIDLPHRGLIDGDARSLSIAAASIVAKVTRDRLMCLLDRRYPGYGFARHKGYCTREHLEALARLGASAVHRRSFQVRDPATGAQLALAFPGEAGGEDG
jgi:ribonuclease HII